MSITYLSREGYEKLRTEMNFLTKTKRKEIAEKLDHARGFGDLSENAEYETAKKEQDINEAKIAELSLKLSNVQITDDMKIPKDKAFIGAKLKLKDLEFNEEMEIVLVGEAEADGSEEKISVTSPFGKGLLGHKAGETVSIKVPAGTIKYKILKISR